MNDGVSEHRDNEADNGIKNGVFSVCNFFRITTRENIAKATVNQHNDRDEADDE